MTVEKAILGVIPGLQATSLMGQSLKMAKFDVHPRQNHRGQMRTMLRGTTRLMIGIPLISATSSMISDIK